MILTKAGSILGPIATVLGYIMDILFRFTDIFGIFNVGLCIILFTIVMKTLMIPLTIKQQKTTKLMSVMNPEIQAIQKKYKGKTDNESLQRQNVEVQAVYEKYGTSMTGGCLPLLIQMPILFALYRVIYNIPAYVPSVRVYFDNVVIPLMGQAGYAEKMQGITNIATAAAVKSIETFDFANADKMVDLLYKFTTAQWQELEGLFPAISSVIAENASVIERMNTFCGLNMAEAPGWAPSLAWSIPILAALTQWLSTKLMQGQQPKPDPDNPTAQSMQMMMVTMPLFSAFICITMPAGLGIYWIATSVVQIIQQLLVNSYMDKIDIDEMVKKNLEKVNKKRAKQGLPPAKITQNATASLKSIKEEEEREKAAEEIRREKTAKQIEESKRFYNETAKPGSLAAKAAMVQKYNEAHEKRGKNKSGDSVMEMITVTAKTVEDAITQASVQLGVSSDRLQYEVVEKGSAGVLGGLFGSRPAIIRAKKIETVDDKAVEFLNSVFDAMGISVDVETKLNEEEKELEVNLTGGEMGILIGKRGQTLDSLQYLVSLVVNKKTDEYLRVKLDTENYRARRKETLETLAKNIAYKVKRTKRSVALEPMNPYERRIIHSALQNDKYVFTRSEGEEPFRHVVISLKREERRERRPRPDRSRNPEE